MTDDRRRLTLRWHLDAPRERVFRAWTDPTELDWFFNPEQPRPDEPIELDLRVGGAWRQTMIVDRDTRYVTGGIYLEIAPPERLVFAFGAVGGWPDLDPGRLDDAGIVTLLLEDDGDGTALTLDFSAPRDGAAAVPAELFAAMREGWLMTVDRVASELGGARLAD